MNITTLIAIVLVVLIVNLVMSHMYKDVDKQDKGFVSTYHKLTYRRKFIRDLWMLPYGVIVFFILYSTFDLTLDIYLIIVAFIFITQLIRTVYNYVKWQKYKQDA